MGRRSGTLTVSYGRHGLLWWLLIGWWWRPIKWIFWFLIGDICGFKKLRKVRR